MILNASGYDTVKSRLKLLWTNDKPTTAFDSGKTITLDLTGCDFLYIDFLSATTVPYRNLAVIRNDPDLTGQYMAGVAGVMMTKRMVTIKEDRITFSTGYYTSINTNRVASTGNGTTYAIPYRIYGRMVGEGAQ